MTEMTKEQATDIAAKLLLSELRVNHQETFQLVMRAIPVQAAEALYNAGIRAAMIGGTELEKLSWPPSWEEQMITRNEALQAEFENAWKGSGLEK